jgi:hypothetical protein
MTGNQENPAMSRGFFSEIGKLKPDFKNINWAKVLPMLALPTGLLVGWRLSEDMDKKIKNKSSDDK